MFILTCVNALHEIVSVKSFSSRELAFDTMKNDFDEKLNSWREENLYALTYMRPFETHCNISNGDDTVGYWWTISEVDEPIIQDKIEFNSFEIKADGENLCIRDKDIRKRMAIIPEVSNVVRIVRV